MKTTLNYFYDDVKTDREQRFVEHEKRFLNLLGKAMEDGVVTDASAYVSLSDAGGPVMLNGEASRLLDLLTTPDWLGLKASLELCCVGARSAFYVSGAETDAVGQPGVEMLGYTAGLPRRRGGGGCCGRPRPWTGLPAAAWGGARAQLDAAFGAVPRGGGDGVEGGGVQAVLSAQQPHQAPGVLVGAQRRMVGGRQPVEQVVQLGGDRRGAGDARRCGHMLGM